MSKAASQAPGRAAPPAAAEVSANPLIADVARLTPCSGIQFIDIALPTRTVAATLARYVEERDEADGALLIPLVESADGDGVEWHPVTGEHLPAGSSLWVTGYQALEPFLDSWVPLPYFRFLGRRDGSELRFDSGPFDWARLYMATPAEGLRNADAVRAVIAVDTRIAELSRVDQRDYLAPNLDDVVFAPVFRLASDVAHLDAFLASPFVDAWLGARFDDHRRRSSGSPGAVPGHDPAASSASRVARQPAFALEHLARYLTLLQVLDAAAAMPHLQFLDTRSAHWRQRRSGVDLMLDLDSTDTAALLRTEGAVGAAGLPQTNQLRVRDLTNPTRCHTGPIPTLVEFARADFGDVRAARLSGRSDAFLWPSLVRIGHEARRLSHRPSAAPGETGLYGLVRGFADETPHDRVWRFARSETGKGSASGGETVVRSSPFSGWPGAGGAGLSGGGQNGTAAASSAQRATHESLTGQGVPAHGATGLYQPGRSRVGSALEADPAADAPGRMVSGPLLAHLAEDGSLISGTGAAPALRPHFSPAALTKMFIAECLLHAISEMGDPRSTAEGGRVRHVARVVVAAPPAATLEERSAVAQRAREAVDLVWSALGWGTAALAPPRPDVVLGIDRGLGAQMLYLNDEIEMRYAGSVRMFVSLAADQGRPLHGAASAPEMTAERSGPSGINIATLDLSAHATSLSVVDFTLGGEAGLRPRIIFCDRSAIAGDSLVGVVVKEVILPAIAAGLRSAGHPDATALLFRLGQPRIRHATDVGPFFATRFLRRILQPAAAALIERHVTSRESPLSAALAELVADGQGRLDPLDGLLLEIATAEGAGQFRLADVPVCVRRRDLSRIITAHIEPLVLRASAVVRATRSDIVLLSGRFAQLQEVAQLFDAEMPIAPHRIVDMSARWREMTRGAGAGGPSNHDARAGGLVGAALGGSAEGCVSRVQRIAADLAALQPPPVAGLLNGHAFDGPAVPFLSSGMTAAAAVHARDRPAATFTERLAIALAEVAGGHAIDNARDEGTGAGSGQARVSLAPSGSRPVLPRGGAS